MAMISMESARRVHLVEQQLHENEVIDGIFEVNQDRVVAVTSDRVMIVSGGDAKGWALKGIPWRVITGAELNPEGPDGLPALELKYTARTGRSIRNGEMATTEACVDVCPVAEDDARAMLKLIDAHIASRPDS